MIDELAPGDEEQGDRVVVVAVVLKSCSLSIRLTMVVMRRVMQKYRKLKTRNTLCIFVDTNLGLGSSRPEEEKEATCIFAVNMITAIMIKAC